ncbi:DNA polymerase III subunit delta [Alistipes sp. An66]|uniref:DNA polymerase III subunit delta n=1 Tax=Alistipes sp. An66 TaxID=1965650 RepID=UPI000B36740F|nr:DNA polymerase III subunit delta [Alistipes sp. An66]OUN57884.1 DNA polymerase III subunit delta [Alistipes sp. An66]HIY15694.1 DNA polymerase III subunit delta [Candidatus Alistipes cottocaccae]
MAKGTLKFKDSVADFERITGEIAARKFAGIYLLMGEEGYFIDAVAEQLAASILDEAARAFNQITVYGRDSDAGQVVNLCRQMPMMGQYQVVIVKEAQQLKGLDKLALYTQKPSPTTILVICHKEKNVDRRSAFYKGCAAHGVVLESVRPRDYEIAAWLQQFIRRRGMEIDPKALSMLTDHLGTDIAKIANELQKLTVSLPEGTRRITDRDIEANIGISKDFNNFELCKAVVTRDMARALMIADHFARNPKDNPLLLTVMALFSQFRDLFVVNYLRWLSRRRNQPFPSDQELMRLLRKNNTFILGEIKQNAALWDNRKVFQVLGLLREYDAKSKGMGSGGASDGELLRELLLKIFLL